MCPFHAIFFPSSTVVFITANSKAFRSARPTSKLHTCCSVIWEILPVIQRQLRVSLLRITLSLLPSFVYATFSAQLLPIVSDETFPLFDPSHVTRSRPRPVFFHLSLLYFFVSTLNAAVLALRFLLYPFFMGGAPHFILYHFSGYTKSPAYSCERYPAPICCSVTLCHSYSPCRTALSLVPI